MRARAEFFAEVNQTDSRNGTGGPEAPRRLGVDNARGRHVVDAQSVSDRLCALYQRPLLDAGQTPTAALRRPVQLWGHVLR